MSAPLFGSPRGHRRYWFSNGQVRACDPLAIRLVGPTLFFAMFWLG
ncbi:MAG TPA: hypothetical protein VFE15_04275 [Marmoricola sp.]|jgi:hypothetical protein|nr:hypothetical protein [Marmoricola sp.]